ncbi:MAG: competence/damage-inducible protein A [Bacteroidales bacterium]|jgi:nicotinamide-nucleotide amidase|nr:competence/damage-inducible protein A [Bacteroidales bacterium]
MLAEIISIGDELLIGQVINTNAAWISEQLNFAGIRVVQISAIPDNKETIKDSLNEATKRADIILMTGGLGPTKDDITKYTLCEYFSCEMVFDEGVYQHIVQLFKEKGFRMNDLNKSQANIPSACKPFPNFLGTAPGMWFEKNNHIFISMPGVPFEMKAMMTNYIIPEFQKQFKLPHIFHKTILTQGIPESLLAQIIESWENNLPKNIKLAYLPQPGIVRLRLSSSGTNSKSVKQLIDEQIEKLKKIIPTEIFGYDNETLEEVVGNMLKKSGQTLSTAESCTGGYIAHLITSIPGSSAYFKGSVVAYANEIKENLLGVSKESLIRYGAVSQEVVNEMAAGARKIFNTDFSIAVSGIAGPDGGTEEKPVGTIWIALSSAKSTQSFKFKMGDHRQRNIRRTALTALNMLRRELIESM